MTRWTSTLDELAAGGAPLAVVTVTATQGSTPREVGAKMFVPQSGAPVDTIGGGRLEELAIADARQCLASGTARTFRYPLGATAGQCCGGVVEVLVEVLNVGPTLLLFGAGHVGLALCQTLDETPFVVHAVDDRPEWIDHAAMPTSVVRHPVAWEDAFRELPWDAERAYVCVMSPRHDWDEGIIDAVLSRPARFIGLIGSETKWRRIRGRLSAKGRGDAELDRVKCPLGLDIGGKSPREVAISIAAELLKVHHGK